MALTVNHPMLKEQTIYAYSGSVGASPVATAVRVPFRGKVVKVGLVVNAAFTTDMSVAYTVNGTAMTGSPFTVTASGSGIGTSASAAPTGANTVAEDDWIGFTPSGSTGTSTGIFYAVIQAA